MQSRLEPLPIVDTMESWLDKVHTASHLRRVKLASTRNTFLDADTYVNADSWRSATRAVDAVLSAVDAVLERRVVNAFCAVRPPGHHAETDRAMGFCLLNNVAIGARYARIRHGLRRVLIVDWDVHHGNGTQEIFYEDSSVFYFSLHQYPLYPGTGSDDERGSGEGEACTMNVPMRAGLGDKEYVDVFERELAPAADRFKPDLILISAGFDAHHEDPLAGMNVTTEGFGQITRLVRNMADRHAGGRLVSVLEGGYHLEALSASVEVHLSALAEA